jgi:4-hydroxy 2-oxovalerate aldolase
MEIIDVTLRDGGHAVDFDWPIEFAKTYYETLSGLKGIKTIELGYWGQTSKTSNMFYNLDFEKVCDVTNESGRKNVSIMIDYHYCSHEVSDYPTDSQSEISMIRMCSRKEDINQALEFGKELKQYTNINVSFNIFNASNYSEEELVDAAEKVTPYPFDYIYFADTHGTLNLVHDLSRFKRAMEIFKSGGKKVGFHLHDHSGLAMVNYNELVKNNLDSTDTSVRGMGKGSGNLKLEYVLDKRYLGELSQLILDNEKLLTITPSPYELITSKYGLTDNYAKGATELTMPIDDFESVCKEVTSFDKDSYNKKLLERERG